MAIGQKIRELRTERGLTQEMLAKGLGLPRVTLKNYETGYRQVPNDLIPKIAKFFGVTTDYLFGLED
ncbi:MAG: helix-turn-helix domain-containing protein [Firmicutes bacterium]|nr:helix-turn-helix domain-containing protein [Bacillota bacterium]